MKYAVILSWFDHHHHHHHCCCLDRMPWLCCSKFIHRHFWLVSLSNELCDIQLLLHCPGIINIERDMGVWGVAVLHGIGPHFCAALLWLQLKNCSIAVIKNLQCAMLEYCPFFCMMKTDSFPWYCSVHYPQCSPPIN